jgi:hypothetical protein
MIERKKQFNLNDTVLVSAEGGWKRDCKGTISSSPEPTKTLQGSEYYYWVKFDEPEEDINGSDKYSKAQILSQYISLAS